MPGDLQGEGGRDFRSDGVAPMEPVEARAPDDKAVPRLAVHGPEHAGPIQDQGAGGQKLAVRPRRQAFAQHRLRGAPDDAVRGGRQEDAVLRLAGVEDRGPAVVEMEQALVEQQRGVGVELPADLPAGRLDGDPGQGVPQTLGNLPAQAVPGDVELGVLEVVGPHGIGGRRHQPDPAALPPSLGHAQHVGVGGLPGPLGGGEVQQHREMPDVPAQPEEGGMEHALWIVLLQAPLQPRDADVHPPKPLLRLAEDGVQELLGRLPLQGEDGKYQEEDRRGRRHR